MTAVTGFRVPPLSRDRIEAIAAAVRALSGFGGGYFPILPFIETKLPPYIRGFDFKVVPEEELLDEHAKYYPRTRLMVIREDVYERARNGKGRDRMTIAHELGHVFLHGNVPLARAIEGAPHEAFRDSEWQATAFGAHLLMPTEEIALCVSVEEITEKYGVSRAAARVQRGVVEKRKGPLQR